MTTDTDYKIFNEDCMETMRNHIGKASVDIILTSPPYPTSNSFLTKKNARNSNISTTDGNERKPTSYPHYKYDIFVENFTPDEYIEWSVNLFNCFDNVLRDNGVVLYNLSYSSKCSEVLPLVISNIIQLTNLTFVDMVCWKKPNTMHEYQTPNKLTRIFELIYVFAKKQSVTTHICIKPCKGTATGVNKKIYTYRENFIEAKNNDGVCKLNRATFSTELCEKIIDLYAPMKGLTVYDPFNGTGTTGVACKRLGMKYIGSEISDAQVKYSIERIEADDGIPKFV